MVRYRKILALHPNDWAQGGYAGSLGFEVRHVSIGGTTPRRLDGHESWDGIGEKATNEGIESLLMRARRFTPDVIFFGIHFGLTPEIVKAASKAAGGASVVMHYTDQRDGVPKEVEQYRDVLDLLLLTNTDEADHAKYREIGLKTDTFYDGINPKEYYRTFRSPDYDAFFGGNNFAGLVREIKAKRMEIPQGIDFRGAKFRERFIVEVAKRCKLRVLGNYGWDSVGIKALPPVYHPFYISELHSAKVILNTINAPRDGLLTRRMWRSIASGRLFLTQYVQGMERVFADGVNMAWFSTIEEGLDKLKWYVENDDAREKVAQAGIRLILTKHTFENRLAQFGEVLRKNGL